MALDKVLTGDTIGERLINAREEWGYTQQDVENGTGVKRSTLSNYEANRSVPRAKQLNELCKFYVVSPEWILYGTPQEDDSEISPQTIRLMNAVKGMSERTIEVVAIVAESLKDLDKQK